MSPHFKHMFNHIILLSLDIVMLYKVLTLCTILTSYVNLLIISFYIYKIFTIFIEVYFEEYFHLMFWKGLFIHKNKFNTNYNMFLKLYEYQIF